MLVTVTSRAKFFSPGEMTGISFSLQHTKIQPNSGMPWKDLSFSFKAYITKCAKHAEILKLRGPDLPVHVLQLQ